MSRFRGRTLVHTVENGLDVFEGDILLDSPTPVSSKDQPKESLGVQDALHRWPDGVMPYQIEAGMPDTYRIRTAIDHWNTKLLGSVRIVPRTDEPNYVVFRRPFNPGTCASNIGMLGTGAQVSYIGDFCSTGNVIHEIGHSLGLWHEQGRADRDRYIQILKQNIAQDSMINFDQPNALDLGEYDFGSIMHYPATAFSANGQPTIVTIPPGIPIGQRDGLSAGDVAGVRTMYGPKPAPAVETTISTNPTGMPVAVDGRIAITPVVVRWESGSQHTIRAIDPEAGGNSRALFVSWSDRGAREHTVVASPRMTFFSADYAVTYALTARSVDPYVGTVAIAPESSDGFYPAGSTVSLSATATEGFCFTGWMGVEAQSPTVRLSVAKAVSAMAGFQPGAVTLSANALTANVEGGPIEIGIQANHGCRWAVTASEKWLRFAESDGAGNGILKLIVDANDSGLRRTATVEVAGQILTVTQD